MVALVHPVSAEVLAPSPRRDPFSPTTPACSGTPTLSPDFASSGPAPPSPGPPPAHFAEVVPVRDVLRSEPVPESSFSPELFAEERLPSWLPSGGGGLGWRGA